MDSMWTLLWFRSGPEACLKRGDVVTVLPLRVNISLTMPSRAPIHPPSILHSAPCPELLRYQFVCPPQLDNTAEYKVGL